MPRKKKRKGEAKSSSVTVVGDLDDQLALDSVEERWDKDLAEDRPVVEELRSGYHRKGSWEIVDGASREHAIDSEEGLMKPASSDSSVRKQIEQPSPPRRQARDEDASPPRRRRAEEPSPPRRQARDEDASPPRRRRAEEPSPPRRQARDEDASPPHRESSGAAEKPPMRAAGLQSADDFGRREREIRATRDLELAKADPSLSGAHSATVYRDKRGKKLDMLNEFMRQQTLQETKVRCRRWYE